LQNYISTCLL